MLFDQRSMTIMSHLLSWIVDHSTVIQKKVKIEVEGGNKSAQSSWNHEEIKQLSDLVGKISQITQSCLADSDKPLNYMACLQKMKGDLGLLPPFKASRNSTGLLLTEVARYPATGLLEQNKLKKLTSSTSTVLTPQQFSPYQYGVNQARINLKQLSPIFDVVTYLPIDNNLLRQCTRCLRVSVYPGRTDLWYVKWITICPICGGKWRVVQLT